MRPDFIKKSVALFVATMLLSSAVSIKAQFSTKQKTEEYEFSISPKTTIVYDQIEVISLSAAARYCFTDKLMLGLQLSPAFYSYLEQTSETSYTYRSDVFMPLSLSFRYNMMPYEKISPYVSTNAGAGIMFTQKGMAFGLHAGLYFGLDLIQRENFDFFVELGAEYSIWGALTPLRIGFRL